MIRITSAAAELQPVGELVGLGDEQGGEPSDTGSEGAAVALVEGADGHCLVVDERGLEAAAPAGGTLTMRSQIDAAATAVRGAHGHD